MVSASNIIVGIGDFSIDDTSVGSTRGGVTITKNIEVFEKIVDQKLSPVGLAKVRETYSVKTEVAEATLANIKAIWDVPSSIEAGVGVNTLSLGIEPDVTYKTLTFYGKSPSGLSRKFQCYKAFVSEVGDTVLTKDDITVVPVTFTLFQDTTKPDESQIGYIEDSTS